MSEIFKLSSELVGHSNDVRAVATTSSNSIISGSRDRTIRQWDPLPPSSFTLGQGYLDHQHFVSSLATLPPSDKYPEGILISGSNDKTARIYAINNPTSLYTLRGHTESVCFVAACMDADDVIVATCSWDKTVKIWRNGQLQSTLVGHEQAVWGACFENQNIWTCSADRTIKVWTLDGKLIKSITAHEDTIRGLVYLQNEGVVSCSNDATLKLWSTSTYECLKLLGGHNNYIYSVCALPDGRIASCGEDRVCKVWKNFECQQTISLPVESAWCVAALPNNDIAIATNDAKVRVFSSDPSRYANDEQLKIYDTQLSQNTLNSKMVGDIKKEDIPGMQALGKPGARDGQQKMIKTDAGKIELYTWVQAESTWQCVGEVVDGVGSSKQLYQGREYDYVFDIDVGEGSPNLKLPYNVNEDPWVVAKKFIDDNSLSPMFLEQVAKFIITNSGGVNIGQEAIGNCDPWTSSSTPSSTPSAFASFLFPVKQYVSFSQYNINGLLKKLGEFNDSVVEDVRLSSEEINTLTSLSTKLEITDTHVEVLSKLFQWPEDKRFPVIDLARVLMLSSSGSKAFASHGLLAHLLSFLQSENEKRNIFLSLRVFVNCFQHGPTREFCEKNMMDILTCVARFASHADNTVCLSLVSLILNFGVALCSSKMSASIKSECKLQALVILLEVLGAADGSKSEETLYRSIMATGTLLVKDEELKETAKALGVRQLVEPYASHSSAKISSAAKETISYV